ncbi:TM2 domain-containing protein 3-like [Paramacrobiotus metropolitanus]|uniref:TM2 domain-containing protein 3-like n=1 Tax=Paramacrobiotus metropolitanus TaxID=2943436 RepID=UPI0024464FB7|nr:TM2 domain-containing protein 3-like [Paramacrobiotus metropolitanus]
MPWFWPLSVSVSKLLRILMITTVCHVLDAASKGNTPTDPANGNGEQKVDSSFKKLEPDGPDDKPLALGARQERMPAGMPPFDRSVPRYWPLDWHHFFEPNFIPELPYLPICSDPNIPCRNLSAQCLSCDLRDSDNYNCTYGESAWYRCETKPKVQCKGESTFYFPAKCRFCYQTEFHEHTCVSPVNCRVGGDPWKRVRKNCTANHDVICLGNRRFHKADTCNFSSGHRWSVAMILSITLGGFGGDRFYLGHWQEGVGKLFSFGGLGVWTVVDIILIAIGYLRPRDGSLYIDYDL